MGAVAGRTATTAPYPRSRAPEARRDRGGHVVGRHEGVVRVVVVQQLGEEGEVRRRRRGESVADGPKRQPSSVRHAEHTAANESTAQVDEEIVVRRDALDGRRELQRGHVRARALDDDDAETKAGERGVQPRDRFGPGPGIRRARIPG